MSKLAAIPLILLSLSTLARADSSPDTAPPGWNLIWSDDFQGDKIDRSKWTFDIGNGTDAQGNFTKTWGWGNSELQYYSDRPANAFVKDGMLHIVALHDNFGGSKYSSARLVTRSLFTKTFGRFEFRAKLPVGKGLWPALWLMPQDSSYGAWASSGEIDVMEARGREPTQIVGSIIYGSTWPGDEFSSTDFILPNNQTINAFHTYTLEWEPGVLRWYLDDNLYSVKRNWWSSSKTGPNGQGVIRPPPSDRNPWPAPFDKPFYLLMNLSVGGIFSGYPHGQTAFPQEMLVSYVRVYDRIGGYTLSPPGDDVGKERHRPDR